jgi:hypothetical protein
MCILFVSGCATTRFIANPTPPQELKISGKDENLAVTLDYIILPNGPGAWVKDALWDEYVLSFRNVSDKAIPIQRIRLIDPRGQYIERGFNAYQLEGQTKSLAMTYKEAVGLEVVSTVGMVGVEAASMLLGAAFIPLGILAEPAILMGQTGNMQDMEKIQKEFERRQTFSFTLAPDGTYTGSAFFPIIPSPKTLVIEYMRKNEMRVFELPLEKLAGLHVAPKNSQKAGSEAKGR